MTKPAGQSLRVFLKGASDVGFVPSKRMNWRFRKRIRICPGVWINLSKGPPSLSIGGHGATLNISKKGLKSTYGIPGTGISAQESMRWKQVPVKASDRAQAHTIRLPEPVPDDVWQYRKLLASQRDPEERYMTLMKLVPWMTPSERIEFHHLMDAHEKDAKPYTIGL